MVFGGEGCNRKGDCFASGKNTGSFDHHRSGTGGYIVFVVQCVVYAFCQNSVVIAYGYLWFTGGTVVKIRIL